MIRCYKILMLALVSAQLNAQVSVVTQHNNHARTGWNAKETKLTIGNVKTGSFGQIFSRPVDDQIYAQPLVLSGVTIPGAGKRNVVYVATVNNTVYAYEADSIYGAAPYWETTLNPAGDRAVKKMDINQYYEDFAGKMGTVGTPVIDSTTNTLYVVAKSISTSNVCRQFLHALDVATGEEKANSPVLITATMNSTGSGSAGGVLTFDALKQNQRSGLLLLNGIVYIAWASHGDTDPYHGWIMGYDKTTMQQKIVYNATAEGYKGGIWMAACGIAADSLGNLYVAVGNGSVGYNGDPSDLKNRSESALKLTPSGATLTVSSFFTPTNFPDLEAADLDFGVTGMLLIPGTNRAFSGAKDGRIYLMNRNDMGGYNAVDNQVIQTFYQSSSSAHNLTSLTYYHGEQNEYVYVWSDNVSLNALPYNRTTGQFDMANIRTSSLPGPVGYNGAFLSASSNGVLDSTAILWTSYADHSCNANQATCPGILRALSASDITKELWNSNMAAGDNPGNYAKFNCPTIANGKVYLATFSNRLMVYGIKKDFVMGLPENQGVRPHVYPNPAKDILHVACPEDQTVALSILDMNGRILLKTDALHDQDEINIAHIANGLYITTLQTKSGIRVEKLSIQH